MEEETKQYIKTVLSYLDCICLIYDQLWNKLSILSKIKRDNSYSKTSQFSIKTDTDTGLFLFNLDFYDIIDSPTKKGYFSANIKFYPYDKKASSFYMYTAHTNNYLLNSLYSSTQQKRIVKDLMKLYISQYIIAIHGQAIFN